MTTALYRRYRPESFAEVIGQEHVTEPLIAALTKNRVNHAYLFSGPRGCGKTTSARILARCLNCAQGPTPTPCGTCESCRELSRDGGGSLDVIEMDAASHGGVDHARDLRERATFAPVRDRYKIFIIDEAHMVTREGFNALLKIVEEPPEHIKFIFATTEPNKVLGTIRSRTHHYPFRLVPPQTLGAYLKHLCQEEGVQVEEGVLPLVVRAGGGSVRDSLSILDQLIAGAAEGRGISYNLAVALLGFTHGELLDEVIDAFTSGQASALFTAVDRVIQSGQDPRRFVEDLLERFRDLIIVKAVPDSAASLLREAPEDQLARMRAQAEKLGSAELTRAADVINQGLNEMSGALNPQLHLELLCARVLVAAGDSSPAGLSARLERLERQAAGASSSPEARPTQPTGRPVPSRPEEGRTTQPASTQEPQAPAPLASAPLAAAPLANHRPHAQSGQSHPAENSPAQGSAPASPQASQENREEPVPPQPHAPAQGTGSNTVDLVRNSWQDILASMTSGLARAGFGQCEPVKFENNALFIRGEIAVLRQVKGYLPQLQQALDRVLGLQVQIRGEVKKAGGTTATPRREPQAAAATSNPQDTDPAQDTPPTAPIADGPRGGEHAWAEHGQPRSQEPPAWSQDDWNNPVTSWQVAPIPSSDPEAADGQPEGNGTQAPSEGPGREEAPATDTDSQSPAGAAPHLRILKGDADPVEVAKSRHPSSPTGQEHHSMTVAPDVSPQQDGQVPGQTPGGAPPAGKNPEESAAESAHAVSTQPVPVSQGLAEAGHKEADNAALNRADTPAESHTGGQIAHEYAQDEDRHPDHAPEDEPEYISGVGHLHQVADTQAEPAQAESQQGTGQPDPEPSPRAQGRPAASTGSRPSFRERHAAQIAAGKRSAQAPAPATEQQDPAAEEEFTPSEEDITLESAVLIGQRAVEKILGGTVIDEKPLHQP